MGGNVHILHIGKNDFSRSKQSESNGKSTLTFFIPAADFNALAENEEIWMSYGEKTRTENPTQKEIETMCTENPNACWYLGKFTKGLLSK